MAWPLLIEGSPTKLRSMNVKNKRFIGRGNLSDKNYVSLVEQHKLSKEYMLQARIGLYLVRFPDPLADGSGSGERRG